MNELICQATGRVVPRFDSLLRSMGSEKVDIRVLEARVGALVAACWSLATPFYLINGKHCGILGPLINQMEIHHAHLLLALEQAEREKGELPLDTTAVLEEEDEQCTKDAHTSAVPSTSNEVGSSTTTMVSTSRLNGALLMKESSSERKGREEPVRISVDDAETDHLLAQPQPPEATSSSEQATAASDDGEVSVKRR